MPLIILGLIFVIGVFILYLFSTYSSSSQKKDDENKIKKEENVIFLPDDIESIKEKHRKRK